MTTVFQRTVGSGNRSSPPSRAGAFLKFADLDDLQVVVIHTGEQASRDAGIRATLQRAHNDAIAAENPIDPELEPEQVLYVGPAQLDEGASFTKWQIVMPPSGSSFTSMAICTLRKPNA